jgi:hypothetical protein
LLFEYLISNHSKVWFISGKAKLQMNHSVSQFKSLARKLPFTLLFFFTTFLVYSQRTPTQGELDVFDNGTTISVRSVRLSDNRVLIVYKDNVSSTGSTVKAVVGTISGSNISFGTTKDVGSDSYSFIEVVAFSSTKAAVFYEVNAATDEMKYNVLDISGDEITVGGQGTLGDGDQKGWQASLRAVAMDNETVVVIYEKDTGTDILAVVAGTVSGTTISWGTTVFGETNTHYMDIARLTNSKFAIAYQHDGDNDKGKLIAGTLSGTSIALGTAQTFESSTAVGRLGITSVGEDGVIVAYENDGSTSPVDPGKVFYASVSGTTFTINGKSDFHSDGSISDVDLEALSATEVLVIVNRVQTGNKKGLYWVAELSGTSVTIADVGTQFIAGEADDANPTVLTSDLAVLNYTDDDALSGTDRGESRVLTLTGTTNPEIDVFGNGVEIVSGDITPSSGDHTDFGTGGSLSRTFTIENNGAGTLTLGSNAVTIEGANAADFSVSSQPATTVSGSGSSTFTIDFSSVVESTRTAEVHINSDDLHESDYVFQIEAIGGVSVPTEAIISATVFLDGAYNGTDLNTTLNSSIPTSQPYSFNGHSGGSAGSIPANAVDWVLVELREAGSAAAALNSTKVGSTAGFLMNDGTIKATDGTSDLTVSLSGNSGSEFFVVIYHRNHLPIMSANKISESGGTYTIDFTSSSANTYQTTAALIDFGDGKFGMPAGDIDQDGDIDATDLSTWRTNNGAIFSYSGSGLADFNLDGVINAVDRNNFYQKNTSRTRQVPST